MNDPTYTYVKGQGWIVVPVVITKTSDGVTVYVECRKPVYGEYFFCGYPDKFMHYNIDHVKRCHLNYFPVWGVKHWNVNDEDRENLVVVTPA